MKIIMFGLFLKHLMNEHGVDKLKIADIYIV